MATFVTQKNPSVHKAAVAKHRHRSSIAGNAEAPLHQISCTLRMYNKYKIHFHIQSSNIDKQKTVKSIRIQDLLIISPNALKITSQYYV